MMKIIQGLVGLIVGAVWGVSAFWGGALLINRYTPGGSTLTWPMVFILTAVIAWALWRKGIKAGAVCLVIGAISSWALLIAWLVSVLANEH
jgi:hypothetical protein